MDCNFRSGSSYSFFFLFFLIFTLIFKIILTKRKITLSLIWLKESSNMENALTLSKQGHIIKERNEQIDSDLWLFFSKIGDKEFLIIFLDPK